MLHVSILLISCFLARLVLGAPAPPHPSQAARVTVSADKVSVPGNSMCSFDLPIACTGRKRTGRSPGTRAAASAHVCASVPNFLVCEWHWINFLETWKNFVKEGEIISNGHITVTDRPGIGVEMNEAAARKTQIPGTPWFEADKA